MEKIRPRAARAALLLAVGTGLLAGCASEGNADEAGVTLVEYDELKGWMDDEEDIVIIDVRKPAEFAAGHIQDAINVDYEQLVDGKGNLVDDGSALTSEVPDKSTRIIAYCFGYGLDKDFAEAAIDLGYANVFRYQWGTNEWATMDYLVIEYDSFKKWHEAKYPFDDGENYLIDDLPREWYSGDDPDHPGGHIPGAVNIPIELWGDEKGPIDEGKALTDVVADTYAKVVIYCGNSTCGKSLVGANTAVALGYSNVFRYQGGWQEWQDEGNELKPGLEP